jgi:hypothetical protein
MRSHKIRIQHGGTFRRKFDEVALNQRCEILGLDFPFYYLLAQRQYVNIGDTSFFPTTQAIFCKAETACLLVGNMWQLQKKHIHIGATFTEQSAWLHQNSWIAKHYVESLVEKQEVTSVAEKIHRKKKLL